jgi:hypothetical protein
MIDYELAKKLGEAGFPQGTLWYYIGEHKELETQDHWKTVEWEWGNCREWEEIVSISAPTLSELIEACGKEFESLGKLEEKGYEWYTETWGRNGEYERIYGSTPEEAVARLWLALNQTE